ncbi:MAG: amidohydrolase [Rhodospirillales bacterium]|nr:amidohydrolase [Rhodospirillales bacterium]
MTSATTYYRYCRITPISGLAAIMLSVATGSASSQQADLLLTNGKVYVGGSVDDDTVPAFQEAVAVKDGAIVFVGSTEAAGDLQAAETIDLKGKLVLPGFIDAHVHAALAGIEVNYCSIADAADLADADRIIRECLAAQPPAPSDWVEASGQFLGSGSFRALRPHRHPHQPVAGVLMFGLVGQDIPISHWDALRSDGPLVVYGLDDTLYANSAALKAAGVGANTSAPEGGSLDLSQGFFADAAMELITEAIPEDTPEEEQAKYLAGAAYGMRYLNAVGVTGIREATAHEAQLLAYAQLAREGRVTVRSEQSITIDPKGDPKTEIGKAAALRARFADVPFMTVNSIKVFADGVIEYPAQTAALLEPYIEHTTGEPGTSRGELLIDPATIDAMFAEADRQNFDIHTHAIGDGAVRATLDAYEVLRRTAGPESRKLSIAHLELIDPGDFRRFAALQVSANFQFFWALPESYTIDATLPYIGAERHRWLYPAGSLFKAQAPLSAGSDWSVSTPDPMAAIRMAVLRVNPLAPDGYIFDTDNIMYPSAYIRGFDGEVYTVLYEEERLPVKAVVDAYTIGSARELRMGEAVGSIEVGKRADLIVLNRNVFEIAARAPEEIDEIRLCRTFFDGKQVYAHSDPDDPLGRPSAEGCD